MSIRHVHPAQLTPEQRAQQLALLYRRCLAGLGGSDRGDHQPPRPCKGPD